MATELLDIEKSICDIAVECEELFEVQIARFNNAGDQNGAALIAELGHQFSAWANSMRVFEKASLNLDRKLQGHPEIQDQVLRGLDLMQANLAYGEPFTSRYLIRLSHSNMSSHARCFF
jgi:hypothetical protein